MTNSKLPSKGLSIFLSILIPGLGQFLQRKFRAGISIFLATATAFAICFWYATSDWQGSPLWFVIPVMMWIWNIFDILAFPKNRGVLIPVLLWLVLAYGVGGQVTEFDLKALIENSKRSQSILQAMTKLDFTQPRTEKKVGWTDIESPCSAAPKPPLVLPAIVSVYVEQPCATLGRDHGRWGGILADELTTFFWQNPIGRQAMKATPPDANGSCCCSGNVCYQLCTPPL
jgi:TM2 domain-containing membrane protein YozV